MQNSRKTLAFVVLTVYGSLFYFFISTISYLLWLVSGIILGAGFLLIDETWLFKFYREKDEVDNWLVTRSPFFIVVLIPLIVFVVTSTNSYLAKGFVFGMYLYLLLEMIQYRDKPKAFKKRYLQGTAFDFNSKILSRFLVVGFVFFILFNILAIL